MKYHVVTTMNKAGWDQTGRRMVKSFLDRWPDEAKPMTLYAEGFDPGDIEGIEVRSLPSWLDEFKAKHAATPGRVGRLASGRYDYRWDAVKFAHKIAALTDFSLAIRDGTIIWLDADTFTHEQVTPDWLRLLFPGPGYIAWLNRNNSHPECGFVMYRAAHPHHVDFMERFRQIYTTGEVFALSETHDSYVLQHLVRCSRGNGKIPEPWSLSGDPSWFHPFVNGPLGAKLDHMKGPRKEQGRSRKIDSRVPRREAYWA